MKFGKKFYLLFIKAHILNNHIFSVNVKIERKFVLIIVPLPKLRDLLNQAPCQVNVLMHHP